MCWSVCILRCRTYTVGMEGVVRGVVRSVVRG